MHSFELRREYTAALGWPLHEKASGGSLLYVGGSTSILGIAEQFFKPSIYEPFWKSRGLKVKRECNGSLTYY